MRVIEMTGGLGADVAIEAVGVPDTFELAAELIRPGGRSPTWGPWQARDPPPGKALDPGRHDHHGTGRHAQHYAAPLPDRGRRLDPTVFATHRFSMAETEGI